MKKTLKRTLVLLCKGLHLLLRGVDKLLHFVLDILEYRIIKPLDVYE